MPYNLILTKNKPCTIACFTLGILWNFLVILSVGTDALYNCVQLCFRVRLELVGINKHEIVTVKFEIFARILARSSCEVS